MSEKAVLLEELAAVVQPGDVIEGVIGGVMDWGAFVECHSRERRCHDMSPAAARPADLPALALRGLLRRGQAAGLATQGRDRALHPAAPCREATPLLPAVPLHSPPPPPAGPCTPARGCSARPVLPPRRGGAAAARDLLRLGGKRLRGAHPRPACEGGGDVAPERAQPQGGSGVGPHGLR